MAETMKIMNAIMSIEEPGYRDRNRSPRRFDDLDDFPLPTESEMWKRNLKAAMKEAIKEWLDDQFATFGKWSIGALLAILLGAAVWLLLTSKGWKPPP
jgi:hypothetical protein